MLSPRQSAATTCGTVAMTLHQLRKRSRGGDASFRRQRPPPGVKGVSSERMRGSRAVGHVGGWRRQRPIAERDCTRAAREVAAEKSAKESGRYLAERDCTRAAREVAAEKSAKESGRYLFFHSPTRSMN